MRIFNITIGVSLLLASPLVALAEHPALPAIDAGFAAAQDAVQHSGLDRETKSSISNVLKTRHDTVKNSIRNIR